MLADPPGADKSVQVCQNWAVPPDDDVELGERIARDLSECRVRGIERLDVSNRHQNPVSASDLQRLAERYAQTRPVQPRGRIAQIKALLSAALAELNKTNPTDARLISDLFFGEEPGKEIKTVRQSAGELLRKAQERYHEPSRERFLEIRNIAFRDFAEFLVEFVDHVSQKTPSTSPSILLPPPDNSVQDSGKATDDFPPPSRRYVHAQELVAVLLFSPEDPGDTNSMTIEEHQRIINAYGRCWWGWFKADYDIDQCAEIERRLGRSCEVGLWARSEDLYYVAHCDRVETNSGQPMGSPEKELTPEYYRPQSYPAWFSFRSIRPSSRAEFFERFGDLPTLTSTVHWSSESVPEPIEREAQGSSILHISDLRFGEHHRWSTASRPGFTFIRTEEAIIRTLLTHGIDRARIGVVVICGNFALEQPSREAFQDALAFINGLCERLGITKDHIVITPGADDFRRPGDRERSVQTLYREFHEDLYGVGQNDIGRMRRYQFGTFRLNILPVNSVKMLGPEERDEGLFGYGYDSLLSVMHDDYLFNHQRTLVINAIAAHHHILSTPVKLPETAPQEPMRARVMPGMHDARDLLTRLSANRVALYLHGHLHEPDMYTLTSDDGWQTVVCSAGTAGASDGWLRSHYRDNQVNSLTVIDIDAAEAGIHARSFLYDEQDFRHASSPYRQFSLKIR
jgi:hypothetical protein